MDLPASLAWLVDEAGASPGPDRFLAELGGRLLADGLPLAGGALTLALPHPIIARRTWLWQAETGAVIEGRWASSAVRSSQAGRDWLAGLGPVSETRSARRRTVRSPGMNQDPAVRPRRGRPPAPGRALRRGAPSRPGRAGGAGSAARGLSRPAQCRGCRRARYAWRTGETIRAALLYADLRDFTAHVRGDRPRR